MKVFRRAPALAPHIDGREDAPVHRHQMRGEADDHLAPGGERKFLVELGHVAVMADAIGVEAFRDFREQHGLLRRPARAGHARLGVDHDLIEIDRLGLDQRDQRKFGATGVAAGIGDQPRLLDLAPVDFGEAVDRLLLQLGRVVLVAVPFGVSRGVRQPEVGRQVHHLGGRRGAQQLLDHLLRGGVRQRAEGDVEPGFGPVEPLDGDQLRQIVRRELRKHVAHRLAGAALGGEQHDFGARMPQQHAHQLRAGIAGGAEHADLCFGGHGSILIQSLKELPDQGQQRGYRGKSAAAKIRRHGGRFTRESAPVPG